MRAALAAVAAVAAVALPFRLPPGFTAEPAPDVSAPHAWRVAPPDGSQLRSLSLLLGEKRVGDGELDRLSTEWHLAHVRNRSAWGVHIAGWRPREPVMVGSRRGLRFRDRVSGALGATEQTMTCVVSGGLLACVLATAPQAARGEVDLLSVQLLASFKR